MGNFYLLQESGARLARSLSRGSKVPAPAPCMAPISKFCLQPEIGALNSYACAGNPPFEIQRCSRFGDAFGRISRYMTA